MELTASVTVWCNRLVLVCNRLVLVCNRLVVVMLVMVCGPFLSAACGTPSNSTVTPPPVAEPMPDRCIPGDDQTFILSGGPDPTLHIDVDDTLKVSVEDEVVGDAGGCSTGVPSCAESRPIQFRADSGDRLTLRAKDHSCGSMCPEGNGQCFRLGDIFLQKGDGTCLTQLVEARRSYDCSLDRLTVFLMETSVLP